MKRSLLFCLLLFPAIMLAQNHYVGIKLGSNFSDVQTDSEVIKDATEARIGLAGGLTYEFSLLKFLRLGADLIYTQKGYTMQIAITNVNNPENILGEAEIVTRNEYVSIPLKAGVSLGRRLSFIGYLGVAPSFLVKANADSKDFQIGGGDYTHDRSDQVNNFDISGLIDLGLSLKLGRFIIYMTGGYEHSFTNYNSDPNIADTKLRNTGFNVFIGGRFALQK